MKRHKRVIVWMRRALRVDDNLPLLSAFRDAEEVIPFLCLSNHRAYDHETPRRRYINGCIAELEKALRLRGSKLFLRTGEIERELPAAAVAWDADAVYAANVYDAAGLKRDERIARRLRVEGKEFVTIKDRVAFERREVTNQAGEPFRVFTPYSRVWREKLLAIPLPLSAPRAIRSPEIATLSLPSRFKLVDKSGEAGARAQLRLFLRNGLSRYGERRNFPALEGTSKLSPALAIGAISIRRILAEVLEVRKSADKVEAKSVDIYLNELIWREFYYQILANFPHVTERAFRDEFADLRWLDNHKHYDAWCEGRTGYPIVDAGMRQLLAEGWMHNRVRMIVASFLTKDLHINWQWGEKHFFELLCDADIASNNGGWQWTAGTGTDASPWFRIFNPVLQGKKFDPDGEYVKKYVPELAHVPARFIHEPWMYTDEKKAMGKYPAPIVDHAREREVTMQLYKRVAAS